MRGIGTVRPPRAAGTTETPSKADRSAPEALPSFSQKAMPIACSSQFPLLKSTFAQEVRTRLRKMSL